MITREHGQHTRRRLMTLALLLGALLGPTAWILGTRLTLDPSYTPTTLAIYLMTMGAVAVGVPGGHPFAALGAAMWVTSARAGLVAMVTACGWQQPTPVLATGIVWVASLAAALDGVDGWLARRTEMASDFGARFDMEVDAFLILVLGVLVWQYDKAGTWILLSGALRYGFVAAGWAQPWFGRPLPPSYRRKVACVVQIVGLIVALSPLIPRPLSELVAAGTLALLVWSFAVDVYWLYQTRLEPLHS